MSTVPVLWADQSDVRRLSQYVLSLLLFFSPVTDGYAFARPDVVNIADHFRSSGFAWDDTELMIMEGVAIRTASFVSSDSIVRAAQRLTEVSTVFDRVLTLPEHIILSGVKDNRHWLGSIQASATGASGYVSAMQGEPVLGGTPPAWLPPGAATVFALKDGTDSQASTQHVHRFPVHTHALRARLAQRLAQQGWKQHTDSDTQGRPWRWYRAHEQLLIVVTADQDGALMFTHHTVGGAR